LWRQNKYNFLNDFTEELIENSGANVSVEVYAVLDDPDNALEYN
jgi:hypothetical protein